MKSAIEALRRIAALDPTMPIGTPPDPMFFIRQAQSIAVEALARTPHVPDPKTAPTTTVPVEITLADEIMAAWRNRFPNNAYSWQGAPESFAYEAAKVAAARPQSDAVNATEGPWSVSEVRTVEGEYMVVGGAGQGFGLIACCPMKADAELIVRLRNKCDVQISDDMVQEACDVYSAVYADDDKDMGDAMRAALKAALSLPSAERGGK